MEKIVTARRGTMLSLGLASVAALAACAVPADTRAADEAALRKADEEWNKAARTRQVAAWVAFYTDDAVVLPPNEPPATTPDAIAKFVSGLLGLPALTIDWHAARVEMARSGELGYIHGSYDVSFRNPKGKLVKEHGKYLEVWRKQANGSWKCAVDTWSSDSPA